MKIVPLAKNHRMELFACGVPSLDQYLQKQASQDERRRLSKCYILEDDHQNVCGYFTLSMASIPAHELPEAQRKKLPNYPAFPVVLLGRLARDQKLRGQHWGTSLMADALWRSWLASTTIAAYAVVVDPLKVPKPGLRPGGVRRKAQQADRLQLKSKAALHQE